MSEIAVAYLCDQKACEKCSYPECKHTFDISHAVNFEVFVKSCVDGTAAYFEKEER